MIRRHLKVYYVFIDANNLYRWAMSQYLPIMVVLDGLQKKNKQNRLS